MATDTLEIFGTEYSGVTGIKATDDNNNILTYIRPQGTKSITSSGTTDVTEFASVSVASGTAGTPTATKGTVTNHSVTVTPSVTNTTGYITGSTKTGTAVTVSASELVSGSETKTANGTYDVTNLASLIVNVSGGSTKLVQGTFTTGSTGAVKETFTIPYSGNGYPLALIVYVDGGPYNDSTSWYSLVSRYAVGLFVIVKSKMTASPTYSSSGSENYGSVVSVYKNSTSSGTSYGRSGGMDVNSYSNGDAGSGATSLLKFKGNGKTVSYYVASTSYGLAKSTTYAYIAVYSS